MKKYLVSQETLRESHRNLDSQLPEVKRTAREKSATNRVGVSPEANLGTPADTQIEKFYRKWGRDYSIRNQGV